MSLLDQWFTKWRVSFNLNKTIAVLFSQQSHRHLPELMFFDHDVNNISIEALRRISKLYPLFGYHSNLLLYSSNTRHALDHHHHCRHPHCHHHHCEVPYTEI
jgi:hypothetical protein